MSKNLNTNTISLKSSTQKSKSEPRNLRMIIGIILTIFFSLAFIIILFGEVLYMRMYPKNFLLKTIIGAEQYLDAAEISKTDISFWDYDTRIRGYMDSGLASSMANSDVILKTCLDHPEQCTQREWYRNIGYDENGVEVSRSDYTCIEAAILDDFQEMFCVNTDTGQFFYSHLAY